MLPASRPPSWVNQESFHRDFDPYHDSDILPLDDTPPGSKRHSLYEQQSMLANMAAPPTRPSRELDPPQADTSSSSSNGQTQSSRSFSPNSYSSTSGNSQDMAAAAPLQNSEAGPSHLPYRKPRSLSTRSTAPSSPLNPAVQHPSAPGSPFANSFPRPVSQFMRIPSEESRALAGKGSSGMLSVNSTTNNRGSMILYRYASEDGILTPPTMPAAMGGYNRDSVSSFASLSSDSKYPMGTMGSQHGLIAYAYDPTIDDTLPPDEEDKLHDPFTPDEKLRVGGWSWRGYLNIGSLVLLVLGLLALFVCFPVYSFYRDDGTNAMIVGNTKINSTGQADPGS